MPALFDTTVRFLVPWAQSARIRFSGTPAAPNPPINMVAPSGIFETAASAPAIRLSIPSLFLRFSAWAHPEMCVEIDWALFFVFCNLRGIYLGRRVDLNCPSAASAYSHRRLIRAATILGRNAAERKRLLAWAKSAWRVVESRKSSARSEDGALKRDAKSNRGGLFSGGGWPLSKRG